MSDYLARWTDPALAVNDDDTQASISEAERERLSKLCAVATAARIVPRRVGAEAGAAELALDKRRGNRVAHVAKQCADAWGGANFSGVGDVTREAAQVNWKPWWDEHRTWLTNRIRYIATWAQKTGADERWTKSAIVKLNNELTWLEYALRDD